MGRRTVRPPFVWSFSRHRAWERCRREYWYDYYGARGGWRTKAGAEARELYVLKGLKTVPQWVGLHVHHVAERLLGLARDGRPADPDAAVLDGVRRARRELQDALAGLNRLDPRRRLGLVEVAYGQGSDALWGEAIADVEGQTRALLAHPILRRLLDVPDRIAEIERLERVLVAGVAVWVSLDVLVRDGRGGFVVIDWKTGRSVDPAEALEQVALYGAYVQRRYAAPDGAIRGVVASTRTGSFVEAGFDREVAQRVRELVHRSSAAMQGALPDPRLDEAPLDGFPMLPGGAAACATCRYRRLCERE